MSFNGFVFNFINDLRLVINIGGGREEQPSFRSFVAAGLALCLGLIVIGLMIAGATSAIENLPEIIETVYVGFIGAGLLPGIALFLVYNAMGGGDRQS
ncbi:MAG: hypothetical protein F4X66_08690 [Chloroflexi bacterium]|nr:hypothetical protein [Chloroflexota bacterium]